ncbi:N-acetylglucosamine kinase [Glutamicibacter sp. NPDC087344]|uniref:N-acetylglucosamine kinase n=1 Tax=Glutamicibacter sp. NPDC087344 TaxID=3363994 RepID=UPI003809E7CF
MALDCGQSGIKIRLITPGEDPREIAVPGVRTHQALLPQLNTVIREVQESAGFTARVVACGVSGLTQAENDPQALLRLLQGTGVHRVVLAHDSVTSYLGALRQSLGAVVAAGTGVVTLAVGTGTVARVDGWGHIMGDAGSGYWIGRHALEAVMRAHDGRGPATALSQVVRGTWPDLEQAYILLQSSPTAVATVASFAQAVARLAQSDQVAAQISQAAGEELAHSVSTALQRVASQDGSPHRVAALGGVFGNQMLHTAFSRSLKGLHPAAEPVPAAGTGLDGVQALSTLQPDHPLWELVTAAGAENAHGIDQ